MRSFRYAEQSGMTLIELSIVLCVVGILTAIATPVYLNQRDKARDAAVKGSVRAIQVGIVTYTADHDGAYPAAEFVAYTPDDPAADNLGNRYLDDWPDNPWTGRPMENTIAGSPAAQPLGEAGLGSAQSFWTVVIGQVAPAEEIESGPATSDVGFTDVETPGDFAYSAIGGDMSYTLVGWTSEAGGFVAAAQ